MANKSQRRTRDNSVIFLVTVVALFVVAVVGFNFENLSGEVVSFGRTTLSVNPKIVNAGQEIYITVNPGKGCVNRFVGIYDDSEIRRATTQYRGGSNTVVCESFTTTYKTSPSWKPEEGETGIFFVKVFDYGQEDFVKSVFTIRGE